MHEAKKMKPKKPICFFVRCKPQGADIIKIVEEEKRVFIGYPPIKKDSNNDSNNGWFVPKIFNISKEIPEEKEINFEGYRGNKETYMKKISEYKRLVKEAIQGSIVVIPRPEFGVCYLGEIEKFEVVDNPDWEEYQTLRKNKNLDTTNGYRHIADLMQAFKLKDKKLVKVPFWQIPANIRHSLFGRSTTGRIKDHYLTLKKLIDGEKLIDFEETTNREKIKKRLSFFLTPTIFEHFMCELLQLSKSKYLWWHVGGSGDGGVDIVGFDRKGQKLAYLVQCKLKKEKKLREIGEEMLTNFPKHFKKDDLKILVCNFYEKKSSKKNSVEVIGKDEIVDMFIEHMDKTPYSKMIGATK